MCRRPWQRTRNRQLALLQALLSDIRAPPCTCLECQFSLSRRHGQFWGKAQSRLFRRNPHLVFITCLMCSSPEVFWTHDPGPLLKVGTRSLALIKIRNGECASRFFPWESVCDKRLGSMQMNSTTAWMQSCCLQSNFLDPYLSSQEHHVPPYYVMKWAFNAKLARSPSPLWWYMPQPRYERISTRSCLPSYSRRDRYHRGAGTSLINSYSSSK